MITQEQIQAVAHPKARKFDPIKVVLFGSYGRGQAHSRSDVDLLVILEESLHGVDAEVEVAAGIAHPFPMDILLSRCP